MRTTTAVDPSLIALSTAGVSVTAPIPQYPAGSAGPAEADVLLDGGQRWRPL